VRLYIRSEHTRADAKRRLLLALAAVTVALEDVRRAELLCEQYLDEQHHALPLASAVLAMSKRHADERELDLHRAVDEYTAAHLRRPVEMECMT
jgi:hypothetical protein